MRTREAYNWVKPSYSSKQFETTQSMLGSEWPSGTFFPLRDKIATYPVEYGKRAGELIARGARSLTPRKRK
jgi:hypothetical protein